MLDCHHSSGLSDDVLQSIQDREALIDRLEKLHLREAQGRESRVQRLLYGIHNASLAVVESILAWNLSKQDDWHRKKNIEIHATALREKNVAIGATPLPEEGPTTAVGEDAGQTKCTDSPCPFNTYIWNGQNYLQKMLSDLDFVGDITEAISFLGAYTPFHRNPFLLPFGVDQLVWGCSPKMGSNSVWKDANIGRIRKAAYVILLDEYKRGSGPASLHGSKDETTCLRHNALDSVKFYPPELDRKGLEAYTGLIDPPASLAVVICCAHLVLGSVDADVTNKLIYLTKAIVLKIFRQPLSNLLKKARIYNPLRQREGTENVVKLVYPLIMHPNFDLKAFGSNQLVHLGMWLRALASRVVADGGSTAKASSSADRVFRELEASAKGACIALNESTKERLPDDANKENECTNACKHVSVQTEDVPPSKQLKSDDLNQHNILETIPPGDGVGEAKTLLPYPIPITVTLREGSRHVLINGGSKEACLLKRGDIVRICDAHESPNWKISDPPSRQSDGTLVFRLSVAYNHSQILAQEKKTRDETLNRLCYPYKKSNERDTPPQDKPDTRSYTIEERTRHVASDANESVHSSLCIKEARIWKLIPEDDDDRTLWRREFDDGAIPWNRNDAGSRACNVHFRVRVSLDMIEQSCADSPYPLETCVHQQRVNFFESIPLKDVIDEAFRTVCRWHPKGNLIDNVKWAKLSRKMKFLSNVKNSKHEIDMAFVRRSQDRKLDIARFHAIFEDIALTQYPALSKEDALSKVVWASVVMLPDVNTMMWKEAQLMAMRVEAKRVCAQIRISALARRNIDRARYWREKDAAITIEKHIRQFLARAFVSKLLRVLRESQEYQRRSRCSVVVQTAWRRFFWRQRFLLHQRRRIEEQRQKIAATRARLREMRDRERASVVYRDVIRLDSTIATVTISFRDESYLEDQNSMIIRVYVPTTKETFVFTLKEESIRECLEKALSSESRLSWDEMLKEEVLHQLTKRLMLRVVRGRPIFIFSKRNIVEKGRLVDKRVVRAVGELFILSTFRSPLEFVFYTYQSSTRDQMKTKLSISKLREWLGSETHNSSCTRAKPADGAARDDKAYLLDPDNQTELIEWLVKRVVIRKNPQGEDMQLLLQFEAEEERVIRLVTKVQAQWRRLKSFRGAKEKTIDRYEKIFVRENNAFAYRDILTDERQWEKPKLLGGDDLSDPVDEWRTEETVDPSTGEKCKYYANYATGQSSWLSEEDAARMVQRKYRSKHESDLLGKKIGLPDIVKAMSFIHGARAKYEQEPEKLSNIVNYALVVHCLDLDFTKAKAIYGKALNKSPNHPLISRAYGIFLLASQQSPAGTNFQTACRLFHEANVVDPTQAKFQSASEIYFRWAVLVDAKNPLALLNYALLHQCIYKKYDLAEKIYRAALALDQTNELVIENYRLFINERYPGGAYASQGPPFGVVRRSQVVLEEPSLAEWSKMADPECPKKGFDLFWFNRLTKETSWEAPSQKMIWETRVGRSTCVSGRTTNWVEYYDQRLGESFFYDVLTKEYAVSTG